MLTFFLNMIICFFTDNLGLFVFADNDGIFCFQEYTETDKSPGVITHAKNDVVIPINSSAFMIALLNDDAEFLDKHFKLIEKLIGKMYNFKYL